MILAEAQLLRDYLLDVRRVARRRAAISLVVDAGLLGLAWAAAVIGFCALTLRGDIGAPAGVVGGALGLGALVGGRIRRFRTVVGPPADLVTLARSIAGAPGPLRRVATAQERERDSVLRHELLGATQLWQVLDHSDADPSFSPELAAAYVRRVGVATLDLDAKLALPPPRRAPRALGAVVASAVLVGLVLHPVGVRGVAVLLAGTDARPPPPPQPVWSSLVLVLDYPEHTWRPDRRVQNPSGTIRAPAGTQITLELEAAGHADAVRLVLTHDRLELAPGPAAESSSDLASELATRVIELARVGPPEQRRWTGQFTVRGAGSWVVALLDDTDEDDPAALAVAARRSPPMRIELEPDALPEVELLPLPAGQREVTETDRVELRFSARDDFGLVGAELVYELLTAEGELERHRLPAGRAPGGGSRTSRTSRTWRHRTTWDLSAIPTEQRSAVSYWIEVRDNDPGLGLTPLVDGPGKVAASARQQLLLHDEEAEHAANIRDLQAIRDAAVDMLAARLTTSAFSDLDQEVSLARKLRTAHELHEGAATLLTMIAGAVDALAVDTMIPEREVETLAAIHERLLALHREEATLLDQLPASPVGQVEREREDERAPLLRKLGPHNQREREQLEDEIIRLDDLVDGQIIAHIETLVARLQASQQKLVEKLEQLASGDESVRPEIEQLEQRIREDMGRVQQARAQLRKELGEEWMNLDAFKAMEERMRSQELLEQLARGDVEGALEQARAQLDEIRTLREQVQQQGAESEAPALSEEDRQRMKMLRELSRLQDEQTGMRGETRRLREQWRDAVGDQRAEPGTGERAGEQAKQLRETLEEIDDTHLSREGRRALEDAREALESLEAAAQAGDATQLELFEGAAAASEALERAQAGTQPGEAEARALRKLGDRAGRLRSELLEPLPDADDVVGPGDAQGPGRRLSERSVELAERQRALRERAKRLLDDPAANVLPAPGREAMRRADQAMRRAGESLDDAALDGALDGEQAAWGGLQQAIDSLRQSSPPPPPRDGGDASTEAERDRSLRDQVVEAMREGDRDGFDEDTKRYYEELLR
ncbi:DUF4175 family protein [Enhygromyxa salina]|uniref:Uncharacterized protein n=1 Tax=Enhygromyxa salina TaxID=215803 RepID=A0A2S9YQU1_9BACT|nr:DUF4175 family protein [Enhygromyxa salina]PRQ07446.1 hypothetical protein ENSA7_28390 [Enhygromyxa salina]